MFRPVRNGPCLDLIVAWVKFIFVNMDQLRLVSIPQLPYLAPGVEVCEISVQSALLFASDDDDWGSIPPIEGDDEDDF